jgi:hypothetical protein
MFQERKNYVFSFLGQNSHGEDDRYFEPRTFQSIKTFQPYEQMW